MKWFQRVLSTRVLPSLQTSLLFFGYLFAHSAQAQVAPPVTKPLQLAVFATGTGTWTNFAAGRNLGITAGADLILHNYWGFRPALEIRGTYPFHAGGRDGQEDFLLGVRVEHEYRRLHPYVNFLVGGGSIGYKNGGYPYDDFIYLSSTSTVYSPGVGVDYDVRHGWGVKADFQYQHWDTPIPAYAVIHPRVLSVGVVYTFGSHKYYHD
ncbi:outer membrane beta-barrel protein [Acidipila sp. EB88]|uniref:outer membrane beta-barrel protein n=1 Tax=Acidipila sp. EB88 TaxID=2305226 RepID=UPI000F5D79BE|nr:outer membrane beta-barrel protein [Acidipila sp. EB88]